MASEKRRLGAHSAARPARAPSAKPRRRPRPRGARQRAPNATRETAPAGAYLTSAAVANVPGKAHQGAARPVFRLTALSLQNEALACCAEASRTVAIPTPSVPEPSGASGELPGRAGGPHSGERRPPERGTRPKSSPGSPFPGDLGLRARPGSSRPAREAPRPSGSSSPALFGPREASCRHGAPRARHEASSV